MAQLKDLLVNGKGKFLNDVTISSGDLNVNDGNVNIDGGDLNINGNITADNNFIPISLMLKTVSDEDEDLDSDSELLEGMPDTINCTALFLGVPHGTDMNNVTISYVKNSTVKMRLKINGASENKTYGKNRYIHKIRNLFTEQYLPNEWPNTQDLLWFFIPENEGVKFQKNGYDYYHVKLHCIYYYNKINSLSSIEINRSEIDLPQKYSKEPPQRQFLPGPSSVDRLPELFNNNKGGLCLYKNGKRISNICLFRTFYHNGSFSGIGIKNSYATWI